jgi:hypothetical protein
MKALYNTLTVITGLVIVGLLWSQYQAYQKRDDDAYNAQCPNPTRVLRVFGRHVVLVAPQGHLGRTSGPWWPKKQ